MRVLLADNYNSFNAGDAAILEGMLSALGAEIPGASFVVTSSYPAVAEEVHGLAAAEWTPRLLAGHRPIAGWLVRSLAWTAAARWGIDAPGLLRPKERVLMAAYRDADLVLGVGGAYLRSGYRLSWLRLWQMYLAKALGKPVMLYAQSIGPLEGRLARWARFVFDRLDLITLRDEESRQVLDGLGLRRVPYEVTADAALGLAPPRLGDAKAPPAPDAGSPGPLIGVSVLHWHKFATGSFEAYRDALAAALDTLVMEMGARVRFLSTTVAPPGQDMDVSGTARDDIAAAQDVRGAMVHRGAATISDEALGVEALRGRIASHDLWIGTRMHSCIFATTAGVPAVGIGYEAKVRGYFGLLGLEDFVLDIETLQAEDIVALARRALAEAAAYRSRLEAALPDLAARAHRNARLAADLAAATPPRGRRP